MRTAEQLRAARSILKQDRSVVVKGSGVSDSTLKRLESGTGDLDARTATLRDLRAYFEGEGVIFSDNGNGPGVHFRSE